MFVCYVLQCELLCVPTSGSGFYQWVWICQWILPVGLDFASGSGLPVSLDMKPHGPDSLLNHVIYTQPWHNEDELMLVNNINVACYALFVMIMIVFIMVFFINALQLTKRANPN